MANSASKKDRTRSHAGEAVDEGWQKVLYRHQPFPDNYSGGESQFLRELKKNVSVVHYNFYDAVFGASKLLCHLNAVALYFFLFLNILEEKWNTNILLLLVFALVPLYLFSVVFLRSKNLNISNHVFTLVTLLLFGYAFTPVIRTLTTTISTDTIYAVSILTAVLSCVFHDYGVKAPIVSYPISMSSGLCSAIFLLSRLKSDLPAFLLLVVAFVFHAYGADFRNRLFALSPKVSTSISIILSLTSIYFSSYLSIELALLSIIFHLFILLVCPLILVRKQADKCTIHGPWDEAIPLK